jgi:hypothetical protein
MQTILKRLHVVIPIEVFDEIYRRKDMDSIDNIVTALLCKHYGIELNGKR